MEPTLEEKRILLDIARTAINSVFTGEIINQPDYGKHPIFKTHAGAFVTLTEHGHLRGCIGYIISDQPLFEIICAAAVQASQEDPRFRPVQKSEMQKLSLEISILSEPFQLNSYEEIEIGKHGLILEEKGRRGLLLPQVPIEHNMNREEYLDAICRKSGFHAGYWKTKQLKLSGFTASVFSDSSVSAEFK